MRERQHFFAWDKRRAIAHPGNKDATLQFAVEHFVQCGKEAIKGHNFFAVALSGGSTPKEIFKRLVSAPYAQALDWTKVLLFWGDERAVSPTDPDSNFRMAMEAGLKHLFLPPENVFRMRAEESIEENGRLYGEKMEEILQLRPLDLVMLGVGEDGHTASLFPGTKALQEERLLAMANEVPQKNTWRMTLTYPCINRAKNIIFYVLGSSKAPIIKNIFMEKREPPFPASLVGTVENKALWVLDSAAAMPLLTGGKLSSKNRKNS